MRINNTEIDISGKYHVVGSNPDGSYESYEGCLSLEEERGQVWAYWQIGHEQTHSGFGYVYENLIVIQFFCHSSECEELGIVVYHMQSENILRGCWTQDNTSLVGFEECLRLDSSSTKHKEYYPWQLN